MVRSSKPDAVADEAAAKPAPQVRRATGRDKRAPEVVVEPVAAAEPDAGAHVELPDVEAPATEPPMAGTELVEVAAAEPPVLLVEPVEPASAETVPDQPALQALPARLQGISLHFWQNQLERTMAAGQAIMVCRSPEAAIRLQLAYVQATLAAGFEHAGHVARLSQDIARDLLPSQRR